MNKRIKLFCIASILLFACTLAGAPLDTNADSTNTTYTNQELGFSLQVPANWTYETSGNEGIVAFYSDNSGIAVVLFSNPANERENLVT
ncbi:MAG TPA: hypothetical protein VFH34_06420, partial [Anaerolineales bacterium]|nr:hypothetical protein [Anaerolineales bacterium]